MAKKDKSSWLTDRERLFVSEYLVDLNWTQAAIRAWYSKKTAANIASENLRKPHIINAMAKAKDKLFEKAEIDWQFVIDNLKELSDICMGKKSVITKVKVWDTEKVEEKTIFDPSNAISANEKLGKHYELFTDKVKHVKPDEITEEEKEEFDTLIDEIL